MNLNDEQPTEEVTETKVEMPKTTVAKTTKTSTAKS